MGFILHVCLKGLKKCLLWFEVMDIICSSVSLSILALNALGVVQKEIFHALDFFKDIWPYIYKTLQVVFLTRFDKTLSGNLT